MVQFKVWFKLRRDLDFAFLVTGVFFSAAVLGITRGRVGYRFSTNI